MQLNSHCMQEGAYRSPQCVDRVSVCLCVFYRCFSRRGRFLSEYYVTRRGARWHRAQHSAVRSSPLAKRYEAELGRTPPILYVGHWA